MFLGCSPSKKGYKWYSHITRKIYTTINITLFETEPYFPKIRIQREKPTIQTIQ